MSKRLFGWITMLLASSACSAADLTQTERRWLKGVQPVLAFAKTAALALDIIVQPQSTPGAAPLAMAFVGGRCKLVFSMRGNTEAQATLDRIDPGLLDATLELMAAHELGHCRRYLDGAWYALPAGFSAATIRADVAPALQAAISDMNAARREEGFGDLVGLAWTQQHHPQLYAALYDWLLAERSKDLVPGSHHDTLAWLRRAKDGAQLADPSIFSKPAALWAHGLTAEE